MRRLSIVSPCFLSLLCISFCAFTLWAQEPEGSAESEDEILEPLELQQTIVSPELAQEYYEQGVSYGKQRKYEEAVLELKKAIQFNPAFADAYNALAVVYHHQKRYQEAIEHYLLAIEADPKHVKARTNLALIYYEQKEYLRALRQLKKVLEIDPHYEPAQKMIDEVKRLAEEQEARENASLKIQAATTSQKQPEPEATTEPKAANSLFDQGTRLIKEGKIDTGMRAYQDGLKLQPRSARGYTLLGMAYREKFRTTNDITFKEQELAAFMKAIKFDPKYIPALLSLGEIFYEQGNFSKAAFYFQKVLQYQPDHPAKEYLEVIIKQAK